MGRLHSAANRRLRGALALAALFIMAAATAPAHAKPGLKKGSQSTASFEVERPYLIAQMQSQAALAIAAAVRGHVGRLLTGGNSLAFAAVPSPALAYAQPAPDNGAGADGLAAFAAAAPTPKWSLWLDGSAIWSKNDDPVAGNKGWLTNANIGLDYRIVERGVIGVIGTFEHGDFDVTRTSGTLRYWAAGGGVYGGYALTDIWIVDALAQWQSLDSNLTGTLGNGSYGGDRVQLSANITGYFTQGAYSIRPTAGISYTHENAGAYIDTGGVTAPATRTSTTTGSAGVQVGRVFDLGQERSVEPWLGVTALLESVVDKPVPAILGHDLAPFDVIAAAGLQAQLSERMSFTIKTEIGGLARNGYSTVLANGTFALEF
jgi:hypothetical protein